MVGTLRKFVQSRQAHRSKHQYFMVEGGGKRISPAASLHGVPLSESFDAVEQPAEPMERDNPVRCPPPERSIMQDGMVWRERVARSFRRPIERISTWQDGDMVALDAATSNAGRPSHSNFHDASQLFVALSAPEISVSQMLSL